MFCNDSPTEVIPLMRKRRHGYNVSFMMASVLVNVLLQINVSFVFVIGIMDVVSIGNITVSVKLIVVVTIMRVLMRI